MLVSSKFLKLVRSSLNCTRDKRVTRAHTVFAHTPCTRDVRSTGRRLPSVVFSFYSKLYYIELPNCRTAFRVPDVICFHFAFPVGSTIECVFPHSYFPSSCMFCAASHLLPQRCQPSRPGDISIYKRAVVYFSSFL